MIVNSAYYQEDYDPAPPPSIWHRLNRVLWVLLILTMVATVIGAFLPELQKQRNEVAERARLHRLIDAQRKINQRHSAEIGWIQNDPDYLASKYARDMLDLMKPGETILRVDTPKAVVLPPEAPAVPPGPHRASPLN